jgi:hypothetical protein
VNQDDEHLKVLSILHYVGGAMTAVFACIPIIHLVIGLVMILSPETFDGKGSPPPAFIGWMFVIMGGLFVAFGWIMAACMIINGWFLSRRRHHLFCLVMAGIECLQVPMGTALGVFTIIVLMRDSVKQSFGVGRAAQPIVLTPVD